MAMRFTILGSGSSGNSALLVTEGARVLVDAGFSARRLGQLLEEVGESLARVDAIFLTHEHGDHARYVGQWICHTQPVYASPGTANMLDLVRTSIWRKALPWHPIYLDESRVVTITPIEVPHDAAEPLAWRVAYAGEAAVVANDMGGFPHGWDLFVKGAVEMLLEANHHDELLQTCDYPEMLKARIGGALGHMEVRRAAKWVEESLPATVRRLLIGHLSTKCCDPKIVRHLMRQALGDRAVELEVLEA